MASGNLYELNELKGDDSKEQTCLGDANAAPSDEITSI